MKSTILHLFCFLKAKPKTISTIYQHEQLFESSATFRFSLPKQKDHKTIQNKLVKLMLRLLNDMINMLLRSDIMNMSQNTLSQKIET